MDINWDLKKLNNILLDFYNACNINISVVDKSFTWLVYSKFSNRYCAAIQQSETGINLCRCSDIELYKKCKISKKAETHTCHAGLTDIAVPIIWNEEILGYLILGQMKKESSFEAVANKISYLPLNIKDVEKSYNDLPLFDDEKIKSISTIALMVAKYTLLENVFKFGMNSIIENAINYISDNLNTELSIEKIIKVIGTSKSTLYKEFANKYDCTPGEYINQKRIEKSSELLKNTDMSIENISQLVGFSTASYFSKIFKNIKGTSPLKFRRNNN